MFTEEQIKRRREYAKAYYKIKKATDAEWYKRKLEMSKLNYRRRQLNIGKYKPRKVNLLDSIVENNKQIVNIVKSIEPVENYPIINKDYRIIKHINGFGGLCFNIQIRKSFLGIKYWSYIRNSCGSPIQYADKDEAKRIIEAFLYKPILTENDF